MFRRFDWILLVAALVLVVIGVAFIWSATFRVRPDGTSYDEHYARKQVKWLGVAAAALAAVVCVDYMRFAKWAYVLYGLGAGGLVYVVFRGIVVSGSRRWLEVMGYRAQPSEFMKLCVILALARYLMYRKNYRTLRGLIAPFLLVLGPIGLIIVQPDLGTSLLLLPVLFVMLYVAGARPKHLGAAMGAGLACLPVMWFVMMGGYQKARILAFVNPSADPQGSGWHVTQSLAAIVAGGLRGKGFAHGAQNMYNLVPARHTDFIFSVIAEEWGLIGALAVLALFLVIFLRGIEIAARTREPFGRLIVIGALTSLAFQAVVNVGMTMRLCPITGLTLPFVSYGGSSLVVSFVMLGLILNVGMRRKAVIAPEDFV